MTEFGIVMKPGPGNTGRLAAKAEQLGFDILLSPDTQNLSPDPIGQLNLAGAQTQRLCVGTGVTNPITRDPAVLAGSLIGKLHRAGQQKAELKVALLSIAIFLSGIIYLSLAPSGQAALMAMIPDSIGPAMTTASGSIAVINVVPNQIRGQTMALYLLTISLLGLSLGPTAVALLTDYVFRDPAMIDWSISCVVITSSQFSAIMLWR